MELNDGAPAVALSGRAELCELLDGLEGRRVTLMGLGLFGGGVGAARFLAARGAELTVTDLRGALALKPSLDELDNLRISYHLGGHRVADFEEADLVVAGPGVPRESDYLRIAQRAGTPITSPMNIFLALCPAPIVGVTGSNGKSTTTAMAARMLERAGRRVWLGGNIGISLLPRIDEIEPGHTVVLELSSFQLEDAAALEWSPHVAAVTNVTPNHLDRHGTFSAYSAAKRNIVRCQKPTDYAVLNVSNATCAAWASENLPGRMVAVDTRGQGDAFATGMVFRDGKMVWRDEGREEVVCDADEVGLPGPHNRANAMVAAAAVCCLGGGGDAVRRTVSTFRGLGHRLELVDQVNGVSYYNDSYSTTPESTVAALTSFECPVALIAGGYDKKLDLSPIARAASERTRAVITFGQTGPRLARQCREQSPGDTVVREAADLPAALRQARRISEPGWAVVFSPGCASYDMFENCRERGRIFRQLVREKSGTSSSRRATG